jgi:hypothetical protein
MDKELENLYLDCIAKYGLLSQEVIASEECAEVIQCVCKIQRNGRGKTEVNNLIEELVDVKIITDCLLRYYELTGKSDEIKHSLNKKLTRLKKRVYDH